MFLGVVGDALFQGGDVSLELGSVSGGGIFTAKIGLLLGAGSGNKLEQVMYWYKDLYAWCAGPVLFKESSGGVDEMPAS